MKKTYLFSLAICLIAACSSFDSVAQKKCEDYEFSLDDCHNKLAICIKRGDYNEHSGKYMWNITFWNKYDEPIYFSCIATNSGVKPERTTDRISLQPKGKSSTWYMLTEMIKPDIWIDRFRKGQSDSGDFLGCDF